jgi:hypothetical protein
VPTLNLALLATSGHSLINSPVAAFVVPGASSQAMTATFTLSKRQASYRNEVGIFFVDDSTGRIGTLKPGDNGYAAAALARRHRLFARTDPPGSAAQVTLPAGSLFGTYLIQNSTAERFLARNRQDRFATSPRAFFSFSSANPDHFQHVLKPAANTIAWEDMTSGGDRDFNDAVIKLSFRATTQPPLTVTLQLDPSTDSAPVGDNQTTFATVILTGQTESNTSVTLVQTGATTKSDSSGQFEFAGVKLALGPNTLEVDAKSGDRTGSAQHIITRLPVTPPSISAALAHDTAPNGQTNTDGITSDPTISGTVRHSNPIASFRAGFDTTSVTSFVDATPDLTASGSFQLATARLNQIFGGTLPDGPHTLHLIATDTAGLPSTPFDMPFTLDTLAPAANIQQPTAGLLTNQNPTISGTVTDATSSVVQLQAQLDSGAFADETFTASGTFTFLPSPDPDGAHTVNIRAQDLAGNISTPVSTKFTLDTTPPTIVITNPTATLTTNANLTIGGQVADTLSGAASLTASVDGSDVQVTFNASGHFDFVTPFALDGTADGAHAISFRAVDRAGNASAPANVTFTLDATAPLVVITSPSDGSTTNVNVTVIGKVTDNLSGVASLTLQLGSELPVPVTFDSAGNYTYLTSLPADGSADGSHTVRLQATDAAGNVSPIAQVSFTLDTTPPTIVITNPTAALTTSSNFTISGQVSDSLSGVASLTATVDGSAAVPVTFDGSGHFQFTTQFALDGTNDGPHTVIFHALDHAGNASAKPVDPLTLDTTPPAVSFDLDPSTDSSPVGDQQTTFSTVTLVGQTEPNLPVTLVETGATTNSDGTGHFTFGGVALPALGANSFQVHATDAAGNVGYATNTFTLLAGA